MLNTIKKLTLNRIAATRSVSFDSSEVVFSFKKVGVLIDRPKGFSINDIQTQLEKYHLGNQVIAFLIYDKENNKKDIYFSLKDVGTFGQIKKEYVQQFCDTTFDLLINYYDNSSPCLEYVTCISKSKFRVGFTTASSRFNQLEINTTVNQVPVFFAELNKYLQLFKNK